MKESKTSKVFDIQRKSDFVLEVLEKTPNWALTWGNSFLFIFLFLILLLAALIRYPDKINADTIITLDPPPISVIAEYSSEIEKIYFTDQEVVDYDEVIFKMYSRAELNQIILVKNNLNTFLERDSTVNYYLEHHFPQVTKIGEITEGYSNLTKEYRDFKFFLNQDLVFTKITSLYGEIQRITQLNNSLNKQQKLFEQQFGLTRKNYERFRKLNKKGVISDSEKERLESEFLLESRSFENFKTSQIKNKVEIEKIKTQIDDLLGSRKNELSVWQNRIDEKVITVIDEIKIWEDKYLIRAPISGTLSFDKNIVDRFFVEENESLFSIIPKGSNEIIGISEMPVANSGGIKIGSEAQIRLHAYPYQEYGFVKAKVKDISLTPKRTSSGYVNLVKLEISNPIKTVNGKEIPFSINMAGTTLLIKKKQSLLNRIFDKLTSIFGE